MRIDLTTMIISLLALLFLVSSLKLNSDQPASQISTALMGIGLLMVWAVGFPLNWLLGWVGQESYLVAWVMGGLIVGSFAYFFKCNFGVAVLIAALLPLAMLYTIGGVPNIEYGWGFYSVPISMAGVSLIYALKSRERILIAYTLGAIFFLVAVLLPYYLEELDSVAAPYASDRATTTIYKALLTVIYVSLATAILTGPLLKSGFATKETFQN